MRFISEGVKNGIWTGRLVVDAVPARLCAVRGSDILAVAEMTADDVDGWRVSVALPGSAVSDGAQTLTLIADAGAAGDPVLPDAATLESVGNRLVATGAQVAGVECGLEAQDPFGNRIKIVLG